MYIIFLLGTTALELSLCNKSLTHFTDEKTEFAEIVLKSGGLALEASPVRIPLETSRRVQQLQTLSLWRPQAQLPMEKARAIRALAPEGNVPNGPKPLQDRPASILVMYKSSRLPCGIVPKWGQGPTSAELTLQRRQACRRAATRPRICMSDWHSIRIGIKGAGSWLPWIWAFHAFWLIASPRKAVTRAAVCRSCPSLRSSSWCDSGFIHQPAWKATPSSRGQTWCGPQLACMLHPDPRSAAPACPLTGGLRVPSLISFYFLKLSVFYVAFMLKTEQVSLMRFCVLRNAGGIKGKKLFGGVSIGHQLEISAVSRSLWWRHKLWSLSIDQRWLGINGIRLWWYGWNRQRSGSGVLDPPLPSLGKRSQWTGLLSLGAVFMKCVRLEYALEYISLGS